VEEGPSTVNRHGKACSVIPGFPEHPGAGVPDLRRACEKRVELFTIRCSVSTGHPQLSPIVRRLRRAPRRSFGGAARSMRRGSGVQVENGEKTPV